MKLHTISFRDFFFLMTLLFSTYIFATWVDFGFFSLLILSYLMTSIVLTGWNFYNKIEFIRIGPIKFKNTPTNSWLLIYLIYFVFIFSTKNKIPSFNGALFGLTLAISFLLISINFICAVFSVFFKKMQSEVFGNLFWCSILLCIAYADYFHGANYEKHLKQYAEAMYSECIKECKKLPIKNPQLAQLSLYMTVNPENFKIRFVQSSEEDGIYPGIYGSGNGVTYTQLRGFNLYRCTFPDAKYKWDCETL